MILFFDENYIFGFDTSVNSTIDSVERNSATIVEVLNDRLIFSSDSIIGAFTKNDYFYVEGTDYQSDVVFSFVGFNDERTTFKLTTTTSTGDVVEYIPDAENTPVLVTMNGVLQSTTLDYGISSSNITFTTAPSKTADFTGMYLGRWRKIDDISPQFDSLTQTFGIRIDGSPYSISKFGNSASIILDRNLLITLNGVVQECSTAFTVDGSRLRFTSPPKPGTEFLAYIYIGSEADVQSVEVIPEIETQDIVKLSKEDAPRIVSTVDSVSSIVTFDFTANCLHY